MLAELMAQRRENLERSLLDGRNMLDMAKQLGAESVTLRDRMQRAEELRASGRMDEATLLADEVVSYGRSIVSSEIDSSSPTSCSGRPTPAGRAWRSGRPST